MLNIFKLTDAISESAVGTTNIASVQPYEFIGSMAECTAEFNYEIMSEAANFMEFYANSEEIMTEAAVMNPAAIDTLSESVFGKIKEGVTKFIDKIIAMVKGVIEKLKAFFFKLTGKTDKWLNIMKPKIKDAQGRRGSSEMTYEMHEWNVEYVTNGLQAGISSFIKDIIPADIDSTVDKIVSEAKAHAVSNTTTATDKADSSGSKESLRNLDALIDKENKDFEEMRDQLPSELAKAVGVSDNSTLDAVWKAVTEKATGGEKKTVQIGNQVDSMLNGVEGSKKCIDGLKKAYDQHLKDLGNFRKKIESSFNKLELFDKDSKLSGAVTSTARNYVNTISKNRISELQMNESACNNARGMNVSFVQTMTTEYMNALTRFAGYKEKKD